MINTSPEKYLYTQTGFPVFQNKTYTTRGEATTSPTGDINLHQDPRTGIVENASFNPDLINYDGDYQNEQGLSLYFQRHLKDVANLIRDQIGYEALVEVGCGKGLFLEMLADQGAQIVGFDPAYQGNNPFIRKEYFREGLFSPARGLIMRHVLEHIQNPVSFLDKIRTANGGSGLIYIEVPCFDWICERKSWVDIFYEHVNYFRVSDFKRIFSDIVCIGNIFGGQYIYVVAELSSLKLPNTDEIPKVSMPENFLEGIDYIPSASGNAIVWGGSSKGVIFSLLRTRAGYSVDSVIDINPVKQGRYIPLTGLKVEAPAAALAAAPKNSTIYVMNSNYLEEIKEMAGNAFNYICVDT